MAEKRKVIIADDDVDVAKMIRTMFEFQGFTATVVHDGQACLDALEKEPETELVILDVAMPGMTGYEVCKIIKANKDSKVKKVIMVSAKSTQFDIAQGISAGADDYIVKPFKESFIKY